MEYHPIVQKIRSLLDSNGFAYEFFEHEAVRTSEEAHRLRPGYEMSQGAKALIVKIKMADGMRKFVQCVMSANLRLDGNKLKDFLGVKSISFATADESNEITGGVEFGGIPPFGNLFGLTVYLDPSIKKHQEILFNCGDRRATIAMQLSDYLQIVKPVEVDIT